MNFLTQFGLSKSRLTILVMIGILFLGIQMYFGLSKREDPSITIRTAVVTAQFPGMAPDRMEDLIVDPLERAAREISEIEDIKVLISTGSAQLNLELYSSVPKDSLEDVFQDIRNKMADAETELPDGTRGPFVNTDYGDVVIATVAVTGEGYSYAELRDSAKALRRQLHTLEGIGKIELLGEQEERIWLEIDSRKLAAVGVQITTVLNDLQAQNIILPAGDFDASGTTLILEANGDLKSVEAVRNVLTTISGANTFVRLEDILQVRRGYQDPVAKPAFYQGEPAIMLGIQMNDGQDIQKISRELRKEVVKYEATQPIGISYRFSTYQESKVTVSINDALLNVAQTFAVVIIVMLIFMGLRSALTIACIVPFTVTFAIVAMSYLEIELQIVSIAAIIIALGLLVDNGVVVVQDIQERISRGMKPREAALASGGQFVIPLAVASITTVSAFTPLFLLEGAEGEYGFSLGAVVAAMLVGSWLTSMYILPALSVWLAPKQPRIKDQNSQNFLTQTYGKLIRRALPYSIIVLPVIYALMIIGASFFSFVRSEMFPTSERNQYLIYLDMPKGTSIARTQEEALSVNKWLLDKKANPEITDTTIYVGDGGPRFYLALNPADTDPASAFILVNTIDFPGAIEARNRARRHLLENHPAARFKVKSLSLGGSESGIVEIMFSGPDADKLLGLAKQVEARFAEAPGIIQNENDWGNKRVKIIVDIAQNKARELGVTSKDISEIMEAFFSGSSVSDYREGTQSIPIVLRAEEGFRDSIEDLANLSIPVNGSLISIDQVATFQPRLEFSQIRRENQRRTIKISAKSEALTASELLAFVQPTLEQLDLNDAYTLHIGGETEDSADVNEKLASGMPVGLLIMLAALVFQFNSFRRVTLTFLTIPLVLAGAPIALLLTGQPLSFFAILGTISLAGIIINNAIVLIDQIDIEREAKSLKDAIIAAAEKRITPIMLTTLTTVFGLMPMAIAGGALFEPMAALMIGGLLVASVMTLFFVPAGYYVLFGGLGWGKKA